jgi:hypothetical protein
MKTYKTKWISYIICTLLFSLLACTHQENTSWHTLDFGDFKISTPPEYRVIKERGIDSYVGSLTNGIDSLSFDYGAYSWEVNDVLEPEKHKLATDTVNGLIANIIIPVKDGEGEVGMSITNLKDGQNRFVITGQNIHNTSTILQIFKSIRFKESDTLKNPPLTMSSFKISPSGSGRTIFKMNCAMCHSRNNTLIGPPLSNLKTKHTLDWTYNFIANRQSLLKDEAYLKLTSKAPPSLPRI